MKEIIFNRKDYESYKNLYEDLAVKLGRINRLDDYYDISNYDYDPHCLYEDLVYGLEKSYKFVFLNFDKENIKKQKNIDDYNYHIIITVFERFVNQYSNNEIEFRHED